MGLGEGKVDCKKQHAGGLYLQTVYANVTGPYSFFVTSVDPDQLCLFYNITHRCKQRFRPFDYFNTPEITYNKRIVEGKVWNFK